MARIKISKRTLEYFCDIVTGDSEKSEYLSGPKLVDFFNYFGENDVYGQGFPSRWFYTETKLKKLNDKGRIKEVIEYYYAPINFIEKEDVLAQLVEEFNKYLFFDNLFLEVIEKKTILNAKQTKVGVEKLGKVDHDSIRENILKCNKKIQESDYSGAITNARTLVESVLLYLKAELVEGKSSFDGDLGSLYKDVAKSLNLTKNKKSNKALKKVIGGLFSIISGMAELANDLGDRHGTAKKKNIAERHHAILMVNCANTFSEFILSSYEKQKKK